MTRRRVYFWREGREFTVSKWQLHSCKNSAIKAGVVIEYCKAPDNSDQYIIKVLSKK